MIQEKFSFDVETIRKIRKGFVHSLVVTVLFLTADSLAQLAGAVHFSDPFIAGIYMIVCQNAYNTAKEWIKGV